MDSLHEKFERWVGDQMTEQSSEFYEKDDRTIFINLDHPQLVAAIGLGDSDDPVFRRLAYEVAFSEYAIATGRVGGPA